MTVKPHPPRCPTCRKIRAAHKAGTTGRNEIAKQLGIALATVTAHAKHCGITFDRTMTAQAVEARSLDLAASRALAAQRAMARVHHLYDRLEAPAFKYRLAFKDFSEIVEDAEPPHEAEAALSRAITQHERTANNISPIAHDGGATEARSTLQQIGEALGIKPPTPKRPGAAEEPQ